MKRKATSIFLCTVFLAGLFFTFLSLNSGLAASLDIQPPIKIIGGLEFETYEIGDMIVYFHQRTIDEAIVEKDYIVYQYDKKTGRLIKELVYWREDLPDQLPEDIISREQAESLVEGVVQFSRLYFISPDSTVHRLEVTPDNPCWVVWSKSEDKGAIIISIIDGVEGKFLGNGISPPYTAFSLTGPQDNEPCDDHWATHYQNAGDWFDTMGYSTETAVWPTESKVQSHIQNQDTAMFYEIGHSLYTMGDWFTSGCVGGTTYEVTTATEVHDWILDYTKMPFTFIASCNGMCETGPGKLSHEFRKGSMYDTAVVGYCGMSTPPCHNCWTAAYDWQDMFFNYLNLGWTVKDAFDQTIADKPMCYDCIRFNGDESFAVVPVVWRDLPSYLKHLLKEFLAYRRVFPPDPVIQGFLDRAEAALSKAWIKSQLGLVRGSLVNLHQALRLIQKAGARGNVDTSEFAETMLNAVGRRVRIAIESAENANDSPNHRIWIAWWKNDRAMLMMERGAYNRAMLLFRTAYNLVAGY